MTQAPFVFKSLGGGSKLRLSRLAQMPQNHDQAYNRDQDQKPGSARPATEPAGAERSARSRKTSTDPASGEHTSHGHAPNQASTDEREGAGRARKRAQRRNRPG